MDRKWFYNVLESVKPSYVSDYVDAQKLKRNLESLKPKEDEFEKTICVKKEIWDKIEEYTKAVKLTSSNYLWFRLIIFFVIDSKAKTFAKLNVGTMPTKTRKPKKKYEIKFVWLK